MVTYSELIQFCMFVVALLVCVIKSSRIKGNSRHYLPIVTAV